MNPTLTIRVSLLADELRPGMTIDAAEGGDRPADGRPLVICDVERHMTDLDVWGRPPGVQTGKRWRVNFPDPTATTVRYPTGHEARMAWAHIIEALAGSSVRVKALDETVYVAIDGVEVSVSMSGMSDEIVDPEPAGDGTDNAW